MPKYSIGVDLGGTNLRASAIDQAGTQLNKVSVATNLKAGRDQVLKDLVDAIVQLRNQFGATDLIGVGIGVPGFIRMKEGILMNSANLPGFENFPIRDEIAGRLGAPVILENDANAAALGEKWMGAGQGVDDMILLTLGTGVGGGIISGGKVLHGFMGMAAELGHMTVDPTGNLCGCGNQGCLEKHASATAVEASAKYLALGDNMSAKEVFDLAKAGDERAIRIFASMGTALGIGLANLINIFNFPLYLLSGGVTPAWEFFAPAMIDEITRRSFTYRSTDTKIAPAKLGGDAGIFGAAYLPWQGEL